MGLRDIYRRNKKVLNQTVFRLGLVSLFADISTEMLYPITPIFLASVLGASFTSIGIIEGIAEGLASLLKIFAGAYVDRLGRHKWMVAIGYFLSTIAKPLIGGAHSWTGVLFARSMDRFGKGVRAAPRDVWLSSAVTDATRGAAFGWHRGMDSLGAFIGPLVALLFITNHLEDLRRAYFWALIPGMIAVLIVFSVRNPTGHLKKTETFNIHMPLSPDFRRYLLVWTIFSLVNSSDAFLILKASHAGMDLTHITLIYCFYNLIYALGSPYLGGLSDRIGRKPVLAGGLLIFSLVYFGFGFATAIWQFIGLFGIYGIYTAATDGVGKAYALDLLPVEAQGTGIGWLGGITGVATIFASIVAGSLWDHVGAIWPFVYGAFGGVLSCVLLFLVRKK
jgi:MFS family permease